MTTFYFISGLIGLLILLIIIIYTCEFFDILVLGITVLGYVAITFIAIWGATLELEEPSQGSHYRTSKVTAVYEDSVAKKTYCINTQDGNLWKTGTLYKAGDILIFDTNNTKSVTDDKIIGIKEVE